MRERDKNWNLHHFGGLRTLGIITINDRMCVNINFFCEEEMKVKNDRRLYMSEG